MATFTFELVSPERLLFSGEVESVVVPSSEGEMTVMAGHAPVMAVLKPGVVAVSEGKGAVRRLFVRGGFADVGPDGLTILAEVALPMEELDVATLAQHVRDAEEDVADAKTDEARQAAAERLSQLTELRDALVH
ncbi:F0F1 ATP synthase subunit epsilon [Chelatococcus daeguensis]|uniref:ATP synthase epsilon chain n=2 Tax=Chelatococcus TaxID=28209 RepID=A0AAC9NXF9_9HYPH|nr:MULTISPECIES: F0F1 ATP synthase subunit epsilon [Chelatococcus]APF36232.1 F0F1 ATP synthase subunit epsilon [Chelatococcus daeguensis]KZE30555.1 ATP synthase F1 subunit epsilon [Chelatococcus daeguensis]MBM3081903.1 F0F1 ATP synthase subunit epsilon [Chelatococcus daeguensis]CUA89133.1 ATP synthase, F1 epsilon subunit (delta in mitochondria) [Chelatococcus sambhunathii]